MLGKSFVSRFRMQGNLESKTHVMRRDLLTHRKGKNFSVPAFLLLFPLFPLFPRK